MSKALIVLLSGSLFTTLGAFLRLKAGSLATRWQPLGEGAWGGTTDTALRQSYEVIGLGIVVFGLALVALTAAWWLFAEPTGRRKEGRSV